MRLFVTVGMAYKCCFAFVIKLSLALSLSYCRIEC